MKNIGITSKMLNDFAKKKGLSKITRLSVAEFRELQMQAKSRSDSASDFFYHIEQKHEQYIVTVKGKHLSKNRFDSLSFKEKIQYKNAFKKAVEEYKILNMLRLKQLKTFENAEVHYVFYNPKSRDSDGNSENIKKLQDSLFSLGLIQDDKRKCLKCIGSDEVLSKEYMMRAYIKKLPIQ